jgi:hypothetical protein
MRRLFLLGCLLGCLGVGAVGCGSNKREPPPTPTPRTPRLPMPPGQESPPAQQTKK